MTAFTRALMLSAVVLMVDVLVQGAPQVDCVFGGSCVLPCRFKPDTDMVLHWIKQNGKDLQVHSYYNNQDQLEHQDPLYKGRTSLFLDQISGGNASLRLARVNLQDQGRYMCYASSNEDTFISLTVRAPVARVDIMLLNHTVTCKSGGIYPRPELTWSVSPHPATTLQNTTEVHEDDQGLYNISSSLRTVNNDTESAYSCSVYNEYSARKATIRQHHDTDVTNNTPNIPEDGGDQGTSLAPWIIVVFVLLVIGLVVILRRRKAKGCSSTPREQPKESTEVQLMNAAAGEVHEHNATHSIHH